MCVDMTRKVSTSFRLGVAETACEVGLLCADSIPCMSACLENLQKKILSPKMCVEIFLIFFKYTKVSYFYFLEDSAKFHRNIPYVLYALKMCVFQNILKKILSPKMCVDMTQKVSTSFRLGVAETACEVGLLCADSIPCMSACLENLQKKILSPKMCVEIVLIFF